MLTGTRWNEIISGVRSRLTAGRQLPQIQMSMVKTAAQLRQYQRRRVRPLYLLQPLHKYDTRIGFFQIRQRLERRVLSIYLLEV